MYLGFMGEAYLLRIGMTLAAKFIVPTAKGWRFSFAKIYLFIVLVIRDVCLTEVVGGILRVRSRLVRGRIFRDFDVGSGRKDTVSSLRI